MMYPATIHQSRRLLLTVAVALSIASCGSSGGGTDASDPAGSAASVPASSVPSSAAVSEPVPTDDKCAAWSAMMRQQPEGQFTDDNDLGESFSTFADAIDDAVGSFPADQAEVLSTYVTAVRGFAADPSSQEANAAMADMFGPMADLASQIANDCGVDVVNDI